MPHSLPVVGSGGADCAAMLIEMLFSGFINEMYKLTPSLEYDRRTQLGRERPTLKANRNFRCNFVCLLRLTRKKNERVHFLAPTNSFAGKKARPFSIESIRHSYLLLQTSNLVLVEVKNFPLPTQTALLTSVAATVTPVYQASVPRG